MLILRLKKINLKKSYFLEDVDFDNTLVSSKTSGGEKSNKYFIGYLYDDNKFKPLHIMPPKTSAYVISFDGQTKWMYFYLKIIIYLKNKVSTGIKKEFDSKPANSKKFWKQK